MHTYIFGLGSLMQLNLYKVTTKICGLSRQVVFHDRDNKHAL